MNQSKSLNLTIQRLCNKGGGLLPPEYQQVLYLQSSGTQYIDTGIYASNTLQLSIEFELYNYTYGNGSSLFGAYNPYPTSVAYGASFPDSTTMRTSYTTDGNFTNVTIPDISSGKHTLVYRFGAQILDGLTVSNKSGAAKTNVSVGLFGRIDRVNYVMYSSFRGYRIKLGTSSDEAQYADFIPCYRRSDNKPGMYDLVTNTFFTNAGTGEFTVGPNV